MGPKPLPIFPPKSDPKATVASLVVNRALSCTLAPPGAYRAKIMLNDRLSSRPLPSCDKDQMYPQWLQVIGLFYDGLRFARIALEWFRGYSEMRSKVTLMERAEKIRLQREINDAIGNVGAAAEVGGLYKDDAALAGMAQHAYEIDQVDRFRKTRARLFFAGVFAFIARMVLQTLAAWPGCCASIGITPQSLG